MKFCIVGSGGVGGYFGARLAADGNDVTFVARGAHKAAMEQNGLRIRSTLGDLHVTEPTVLEDPRAAGLCDYILVCVKMWDCAAVADMIRPNLAHDSAVISLQNGVGAEEILVSALGERAVLGGCAHISSHIAEPGVIEHIGQLQRLVVGELDGLPSWRQEGLQAACESAGIDVRVAPDIRKEIWRKFVHLTPFAGAACFYRAPLAALLEDDDRRNFLASLVSETVAVARAEGADLEDGYEDTVLAWYPKLPAAMKPSMLIDLEAGRPLELDWLTGEVVERAGRFGLATPASAKVVEALASSAAGKSS